MRGVFDGCIDSLSYIPEDATCAQLRCHYYTGRATSRMWGSKYRNGVMTDLGDIEESVWVEAARRLVRRNDDQRICDLLLENTKELGWHRTDAEREKYTLELYAARIFENEKWVDYQKFRLKMLEAGIVPASAKEETVSVDLLDYIKEA